MNDAKEQMAEIMMQIMKAIKEVMVSGEPLVLHYADAKITIEKEADQ